MHRRTRNVALVALTALLPLLVAACRPETPTVAVEVTRLVTAAPESSASPSPMPTAALAGATAVTLAGGATSAPTVAAPPVPVEVTVEVTRPPLGTAERPVQLLFLPTTAAAVIAQRAEPLVAALAAATGMEFAVGIPDDEAAAAALLCAAPADTIAFVSAAAYT
ncbi:MAG: hypothetical protein K1X50_13350, partial [Candidatus Promineofilum sp.]|nr:hypothetical protein [Promineifilum sp.]